MAERKVESADLNALKIDRDPDEGRSPRKGRGMLILAIAGVLILALALAAFVLSRNWSSAVTLKTATISTFDPRQGEVVLTASGYVVAQRMASIASKGTGRIEYLGVEEGDEVKKDQVVARLESSDVAATLAKRKANLEMASAALQQVEATLNESALDFERQSKLYVDQAIISKAEYDLSQAKYKRAIANVASAKAAIGVAKATVTEAEVEVENTRIRAPFDGTVLAKNADIGEVVAPLSGSASSKSAVVTIADMDSREVEADVSESNIQRVKVGQACEIVLDAFPDISYKGYVHKIVPTADRAKATVLTKIRFEELDERVLPEMSAKVYFLAKAYEESDGEANTITVAPRGAITRRDGREVVFAVRDDTVVETPVVVGDSFGQLTEIKSGVSAGERVVLNPPGTLKTGNKIQLEAR